MQVQDHSNTYRQEKGVRPVFLEVAAKSAVTHCKVLHSTVSESYHFLFTYLSVNMYILSVLSSLLVDTCAIRLRCYD